MKRTLSALLALLCLVAPPAHAAGTVTETSITRLEGTNGYVLTLTATGDASDGTFPSTATSSSINSLLNGFYLYMVETDPGSTAPTDNYDIEIRSARAVDIMGGNLANRDTANTELAYPASGAPVVDGALTVVISNNSVNSASVVLRLYFSRSPIGAGGGGSGGAVTQATAANLNAQVVGVAADNAAASGNPLRVAGKYNSTPATYADGDIADLQADVNGYLKVAPQSAEDVAHDGADGTTKPVKIGARAVAMGATPTAVAAADRTNLYADRAGVLFTIGGHMDAVTLEAAYTAAQTDAAIITVSAGTAIVVTQIQVTADAANTVDVGFRVGFGTANTPTTTGVVLTHPGITALSGSGVSRGTGGAIIGVGASDEDLRITSEVPTGGSIRVLVTYYTIAI